MNEHTFPIAGMITLDTCFAVGTVRFNLEQIASVIL
jgi:hypothetical protein